MIPFNGIKYKKAMPMEVWRLQDYFGVPKIHLWTNILLLYYVYLRSHLTHYFAAVIYEMYSRVCLVCTPWFHHFILRYGYKCSKGPTHTPWVSEDKHTWNFQPGGFCPLAESLKLLFNLQCHSKFTVQFSCTLTAQAVHHKP